MLSNGTADPPTAGETIRMSVLITAIGLNRTAPKWLAAATRSAFAGKTALAEKPAFTAALGDVLEEDPRSVAHAMRGVLFGRKSRAALLGGIAGVPALVIAGEEDGQLTCAAARRFAAAIPGSRFVLLPETGHLAPLENPEQTNAAVDAFLAALDLPA